VTFSSSIFLVVFLPVLLLLYYASTRRARNAVLLLGSVVFYGWGAPAFILVILGTTLVDFLLVKLMYESGDGHRRKVLLVMSLSMNLGLLFYFKYVNFLIANGNAILDRLGLPHLGALDVLLPIGISFYTFETVTYVVDVYRGIHAPLRSFPQYLLYILLFPKLIAGPIIRYHEIADQIPDRSAADTHDNRLMGFYRFAIGLAKKVLIANPLAAYADLVFAHDPRGLGAATAWLGVLAYAFQIYFDFSGYSDMAIGLGRMLGFRFPENFDNPYIAESVTDFWRRWHMTLGSWMRNYLYIPLGGNRVSPRRLYFNLWLVFLLSGLWHGAAWTFVVWGAWHGLFLVLDRMFLLKATERVGRLPRIALTFVVVTLGWVLFRSGTLPGALQMLEAMLGLGARAPLVAPAPEFWLPLAAAILFSFFALLPRGARVQQHVYAGAPRLPGHLALTAATLALFVLSLSDITASGFSPFIYFRF
jgi:alginate O-acetyltransferase complex protein AlgI